jgi:hypothetical protein
MRATCAGTFVTELGNLQSNSLLEPGRHDPAVTPLGIGWRLFEAEEYRHRCTRERLNLRKNDCSSPASSRLHTLVSPQ